MNEEENTKLLQNYFLNFINKLSYFYHDNIGKLINSGANINVRTINTGRSLIKIAIDKNIPTHLTKVIYESDLYKWPLNYLNQTDFQYSIIKNNIEYFQKILLIKPELNAIDNNGNTLLHLSIIYHDDINFFDHNWRTNIFYQIILNFNELLFINNKDKKPPAVLANDLMKPNMNKILIETVENYERKLGKQLGEIKQNPEIKKNLLKRVRKEIIIQSHIGESSDEEFIDEDLDNEANTKSLNSTETSLSVVTREELIFFFTSVVGSTQKRTPVASKIILHLLKSKIDKDYLKTLNSNEYNEPLNEFLNDSLFSLTHVAAKYGVPDNFYNYFFTVKNLKQKDYFDKTPIRYVIEANNKPLFNYIYQHVDLKIVDKNGNTYLHLAALNNCDIGDDWQKSIFGTIIRMVSDIEQKKNNNGRTPVHIACEMGKIGMVRCVLINFGRSTVIARDYKGKTPLDLAAENYHYNIVRFFLSQKAPIAPEKAHHFVQKNLNEDGFYNYQNSPQLERFYETFLNNEVSLVEERFINRTDLLRKIFEEFTVRKIPVTSEFEYNVQKHLLDLDLIVTERKVTSKIKHTFDEQTKIVNDIKIEMGLLASQCNKIDNTYKNANVNMNLLHSIELLAKSVHLLMKKIKWYITLPWKEFEYILVAFLTIYSKYKSSSNSIVFKLTLTKNAIIQHIRSFGEELETCKSSITVNLLFPIEDTQSKQTSSMKIELQNILKTLKAKNKSPDFLKESIGNVTKCLGLLRRSSEETMKITFSLLLDDFETTRTFYSLSKILLYVSEGAAIDMKGNELSVLVIQRTIQVFGEYIKNTKDSPNVSEKIHNVISSHTKYLKECLTAIRNDLSHAEYMKTTLITEQNVELFTNIQNDLRQLRPLFINILYDEQETCIRSFIRRMLNATSREELNDICFHLTNREETLLNVSLNKIQILFNELKDILKHRTNEEEVLFQKIDKILQFKANVSDEEVEFSFFNPDIFLLNAADKASQTQTKTFLRSNPLSRSDHEPFQLIIYFILQIQKLIEIRLFPTELSFTQKIQSYCTEILFTSLIGVKQKVCRKLWKQQTDQFKKNLTIKVDEHLEDLEGTIVDPNIKIQFRNELEEKKKIHILLNKLNQLLNSAVTETPEIRSALSELQTVNIFATAEIKNKRGQFMLETPIKVGDAYGKLQASCLKNKKVDAAAMDEFLKLFESLEENRNQELRICFNERINKLRTLLLTNTDFTNVANLTALKANFSLRIGVELVVLNLFEILVNLDMLSTDREYLDDFAPLLSAKHLRNYLAHGDALFDILPFDTQISVVLNGLKLIHLVDEKKLDILSRSQVLSSPAVKSVYNLALRTNESNNWIQEQKQLVEQITNCSVGLNVCLFFMIFVLRGRDLSERTIFNIVFDKQPLRVIEFFAQERPNQNRKIQQELATYLGTSKMSQNIMDSEVLIQNLVNQLFAGSKSRHELIIRLIKICALKGFKQKIDELCILDDEFSFEISLNRKYNTLMDLADKYSFVDSLQQFSKVHIPEYDTEFSLFHLAAAFGHANVIRRLINIGHEVDAFSTKKKTSLLIAVHVGSINVVQVLIDNGADLQTKTLDGRSILHFAAASGKVEVIEMILNTNPNIEINAKTKNDETPLHLAARLGHSDVIKFLINKGADIQAETMDGETITNSISQINDSDVIDIIIEKMFPL